MIVTIDTETLAVLGYANVGGVIDTEGTEQSFSWIGVTPEPPKDYEAYNDNGWKIRKKTQTVIDSEATTLRWTQVRAERDKLLKKADGTTMRHTEQEALDIDTTLTATQYQSVLQYKQDLRDVPEDQDDPFNITWPTWPLS